MRNLLLHIENCLLFRKKSQYAIRLLITIKHERKKLKLLNMQLSYQQAQAWLTHQNLDTKLALPCVKYQPLLFIFV